MVGKHSEQSDQVMRSSNTDFTASPSELSLSNGMKAEVSTKEEEAETSNNTEEFVLGDEEFASRRTAVQRSYRRLFLTLGIIFGCFVVAAVTVSVMYVGEKPNLRSSHRGIPDNEPATTPGDSNSTKSNLIDDLHNSTSTTTP